MNPGIHTVALKAALAFTPTPKKPEQASTLDALALTKRRVKPCINAAVAASPCPPAGLLLDENRRSIQLPLSYLAGECPQPSGRPGINATQLCYPAIIYLFPRKSQNTTTGTMAAGRV